MNAAPTLTALFDASEVMLGSVEFDEWEEHARRIKNDRQLRDRLLANYRTAKEFDPREVPEQRIQVGLPDGQDEYRMSSFHGCSWPDAAKLVCEMGHDSLGTFGAPVIYCEARAYLQPDVRLAVERELTARLVVETRYGFTIEQAIASIDAMAGST